MGTIYPRSDPPVRNERPFRTTRPYSDPPVGSDRLLGANRPRNDRPTLGTTARFGSDRPPDWSIASLGTTRSKQTPPCYNPRLAVTRGRATTRAWP